MNTEWGAFSNGLPLTEFDREMDAESINPGEQASSIDSRNGSFFSSYTWNHSVFFMIFSTVLFLDEDF